MDVLWLIVGILVRGVILTLLLWIMLKLQKLEAGILGLFISAVVAIGLDLIPIVGTYLAFVVLVICIWKLTASSIAPDAVFTVAVSGALLFCVDLFILGALMGDPADIRRAQAELQQQIEAEVAAERRITTTNDSLNKARVHIDADPLGTETNHPEATASLTNGSYPQIAHPEDVTNSVIGSNGVSGTNVIEVTNILFAANAKMTAMAKWLATFRLRGVNNSGERVMALLYAGGKSYSFQRGEALEIPGPNGTSEVRCIEIRDNSVLFEVDGEPLELFL